MNKLIILLSFATCVFLKLTAQVHTNTLIIKGSLKNINDTTPYIYGIFLGGNPVIDSSKIVNGEYQFENNIQTATRVTLFYWPPNHPLHYKERNMFSFIAEPATITITSTDSFCNNTVKGSKANFEYITYQNKILSLQTTLNNLYSIPTNNSNKEQLNAVKKQMAEQQLIFLKSKLCMYTKPFIIEHFLNSIADKASREEIDIANRYFTTLSQQEKASFIGKKTRKILDAFEVNIGNKALNFFQKNTKDSIVEFNRFRKNKYVLIDFWASWCGPCRKESAYLVALYSKYASKNFTMLSVSLDSNKQLWLNAIEKDGLPWEQVSDLKFWNNEVAKLYKVASVPTKFLIDTKGIIIAKFVGMDEEKLLEKKLEKLFK